MHDQSTEEYQKRIKDTFNSGIKKRNDLKEQVVNSNALMLVNYIKVAYDCDDTPIDFPSDIEPTSDEHLISLKKNCQFVQMFINHGLEVEVLSSNITMSCLSIIVIRTNSEAITFSVKLVPPQNTGILKTD